MPEPTEITGLTIDAEGYLLGADGDRLLIDESPLKLDESAIPSQDDTKSAQAWKKLKSENQRLKETNKNLRSQVDDGGAANADRLSELEAEVEAERAKREAAERDLKAAGRKLEKAERTITEKESEIGELKGKETKRTINEQITAEAEKHNWKRAKDAIRECAERGVEYAEDGEVLVTVSVKGENGKVTKEKLPIAEAMEIISAEPEMEDYILGNSAGGPTPPGSRAPAQKSTDILAQINDLQSKGDFGPEYRRLTAQYEEQKAGRTTVVQQAVSSPPGA